MVIFHSYVNVYQRVLIPFELLLDHWDSNGCWHTTCGKTWRLDHQPGMPAVIRTKIEKSISLISIKESRAHFFHLFFFWGDLQVHFFFYCPFFPQ